VLPRVVASHHQLSHSLDWVSLPRPVTDASNRDSGEAFSLYSMLSVADNFLCRFIPLPCAKLLRKEFGNDVKEYALELRDIDAIAHIIARQSLPGGIPRTLCVDALSVDIFKSKSSTKRRRAGLRRSAPCRSRIRSVSYQRRLK
jgi:hypothetical protein